MPYHPKAIERATIESSVAPVKADVVAFVILPFTSTVKTGILLEFPYVPAVAPEFAKVRARLVVPDPVASPEAVIV